MECIDELISKLSWDLPDKIQEDAFQKLNSMYSELLLKLIQPQDKSCWENAAKLLMAISCPTNEIVVSKLLEWLKDMNWPGATTIRELLGTVNAKILFPHIKKALKKAADCHDYVWIAWLKELLEYFDLLESNLIDQETSNLLALSEW